MATMRDVANKAGVSIATVSAVINGGVNVSDTLTKRVQDAIKDVGYRPNIVARSLKTGGTKTLVCIVPGIINPIYAEIAQSIEVFANANGYAVFLCNAQEDSKLQRKYLHLARSMQVAGGIIIPAAEKDLDVQQLQQDLGAPLVVVDRAPVDDVIDSVVVDNFEAAERAVTLLISLGHRRIGAIASYPLSTTSLQRIGGYESAMAKAGLSTDGLIRQNCSTVERAKSAVCELMKSDQRPTALFATYEHAGMGIVQGLNSLGLSYPKDVSFITFDGGAWADALHPSITRVRQPTDYMGREAVRLVLERIESKSELPTRRLVLATEFVVKDSCAAHVTRPQTVSPGQTTP
ncbi:LacI family DNA-binding transcriptional regulator [uncultured Cohaesibacter sp.]|uniref:LacI family DNA-binding transcriptional regulator n=1 Tax=uncultured Cohaesibacter sp. TaxID=1002546 RepID=UPI0029C7E635|nr:LacI family DNA-binding transcriptional regulator [uncultured Cohaesibacter sp.]